MISNYNMRCLSFSRRLIAKVMDMHLHRDIIYGIETLLQFSWEVTFQHEQGSANEVAHGLAKEGGRLHD